MSVLISLFLISSLLHVSTCTVYIVTPDDRHYPNATCHHCHNLQYYLLNVTKYFTSNTQLLFLPGEYYLHTDLIIQNVHNITLIGSMVNDTTPVSVICYHSSMINGIAIINSTIVTVKNFVFTNKGWYHGANFKIFNCYYIHFHNMIINMKIKGCNMMGKTILSNITTTNGLDITFDDNISVKDVTNKLQIYNHTIRQQSHPSINIKITQMFYGVTITVTDSVFSQLLAGLMVYVNSSFTAHENVIMFNKVHFINNHFYYMKHLLYIQFDLHNNVTNETVIKKDKVVIDDCLFDSTNISEIIHCEWLCETKSIYQNIIIHNCIFANNTYLTNMLLFTFNSTLGLTDHGNIIDIINTSFIANECNNDRHSTTLVNSDSTVFLTGPIIIHGNTFKSIFRINRSSNSAMLFHGYIEFSENTATCIIQVHTILLMQHVIINITRNLISYLFVTYKLQRYNYHIPICYFQFFGKQKINKFKIIIEYTNVVSRILNQDAANINCEMLNGTLFYKHNPLQLYQQLICLQTRSKQIPMPFDTGMLCYCLEETQKCSINQLGPIFPGQTLVINLCINSRVEFSVQHFLVSIEMYDEILPKSHCKVPLSNRNNWVTRSCTKFFFAVLSNNEKQCELFLYDKEYDHITIFYVQLQACPMGFSFDDIAEKCDCDSSMQSKLLTLTNCNINDQTILRPANSWISANTHNNSSIYHLTPNCPFCYCLPHSSHLNFSTPNSQCQFNRSGLLCGQCQQNLSTTFGSSNCQLCSNIYLLLIIPIAIAGLLLVFILFCINLTVTDGTINAFIMYTNIIGINDHVFFTDTKHVFTPAYTFISLTNLDLGIHTCFYNGMDDYAKMWLQLAFPFYLMFIATLLIITSRYSITVQRLTARRALPVLATLFLLSYTKILRTVSSVLFSYSTITHLPSKHTTLVWSVDANVPLFGFKFTLLFIACLILFFVLVPFNFILLFTRPLSAKFQFINKFKPLLDAYQGPYKHRFYYWTGLQLLIRAVFFGISALDQSVNLIISTIILSVIIGLHGAIQPFKNSFKNYHEFLYIINLQILYILTKSHYQGAITVNVMVTLAAIQFVFIIIYHIITYLYNGVIGIKINHLTNTLTTWISKLNKPSSNVDLQLHTIEIPEVTYNYREYREPLIGQD